MYVCTYVRRYVCSCMCVTKLRVKDAACERWCVCATVQTIFFASAAMSAALHAAALRTWNGLNEVFHDLLCSMRCNEMCYVTAAPVLQPRIRRWWHRGKVPGRKSVEHECSWLSMQLWKTSTERMPVKAWHSHSGKHHGYDANCAGFSKDVKQPQSSETHRRREHSQRCRFARHLHTLLPTLGQSSGSRGHRLLYSLSCRATRACPPSKKLTGWAPAADVNGVQLTKMELDCLCHWFGMRAKAILVVVTQSSANMPEHTA